MRRWFCILALLGFAVACWEEEEESHNFVPHGAAEGKLTVEETYQPGGLEKDESPTHTDQTTAQDHDPR